MGDPKLGTKAGVPAAQVLPGGGGKTAKGGRSARLPDRRPAAAGEGGAQGVVREPEVPGGGRAPGPGPGAGHGQEVDGGGSQAAAPGGRPYLQGAAPPRP